MTKEYGFRQINEAMSEKLLHSDSDNAAIVCPLNPAQYLEVNSAYMYRHTAMLGLAMTLVGQAVKKTPYNPTSSVLSVCTGGGGEGGHCFMQTHPHSCLYHWCPHALFSCTKHHALKIGLLY